MLYILVIMLLFTSNIVRSFGWRILLGRQGLVNSALVNAGLIDRPISILFTDLSVVVSGCGEIVSYSLILRPNHPVFAEETPIILAEIKLDEEASLLGRIICENPEEISSGLAVALLPMPEAGKYSFPTFSLVS